MSSLPIFVVAGVGNGSGTGGASARLFARQGYRVALIARNATVLEKVAEDLRKSGAEAEAFPVKEYNWDSLAKTFQDIKQHFQGSHIRAALFNAGFWVAKPFLELEEDDFKTSLEINAIAGAAFAQQAIKAFLEAPDVPFGQDLQSRGTLILTGATASLRGGPTFSAFAAGKHGLRAISQSLAKEFGPQNVHVAHAIIDGGIVTDRRRGVTDQAIVDDPTKFLNADSIAKSYWYLHNQDRSAWTLELDLRPSHEKF